MKTRAVHTALVSALGLVLALPVGNASAARYTFSNLYDSSGPFSSFAVPALNDSGTVAFSASLDAGGSGIFTGNGGPTTTIADTTGPFEGFGGFALNDSGAVAFHAFEDSGFPPIGGIFTGTGGPPTPIYGTDFAHFVVSLSFNNNGAVALLVEESEVDFFSRIVTGSGGPLTTLYEINDSSFVFGNFVPINDSGTVAFLAFLDPFGSVEGIVTGSGGPTTTIADSSGPFSFFYSSEGNSTSTYDLNDNGRVAFLVGLDAGGAGIFTSSGGPITNIVDTSGPFLFFFSFGGGQAPGFSLNNSGAVAFSAALDTGGFGIFTGPDALVDEVISVDEPLFGSTVAELLMGEGSLNDTGQIAFFYELADGRTGIARADPLAIPEPGTLALLDLGLLGLGVVRGREPERGLR
jgi:hypothetical protein